MIDDIKTRQARFRNRMRKKGFIEVSLWVPRKDKNKLKATAKTLCMQYEAQK